MTVDSPAPPHRDAYSVREARELLGGISNRTIYGLIREGNLRTFCVGRRRFVSSEAIRDYIVAAERRAAA